MSVTRYLGNGNYAPSTPCDYSGWKDTYLNGCAPDNNFGITQVLYAGTPSGSGSRYTALIIQSI